MFGSIQSSNICQVGEFTPPIIFNLIVSIIVYLLIKKTDNWSWMDRLWGILPMIHAMYFLLFPYYCKEEEMNGRRQMMTALVIAWGLRITHTLYRKGIYSRGSQDPRLTQIKNTSSALKKEVVIIFFICLYQPMLTMGLTSAISFTTNHQVNPQDLILLTFGFEMLILEGIADHQQHSYQTEKKKYSNLNDENIPRIYKLGFVTKGLWGYSRHPNYFAEVCFWWIIYLYSFIDYGISFAGLAVIQYSLFFITSIRSGETLMKRKYRLFPLYQQHVCAFVPLPSRFEQFLEKQEF